MQIVYVLYNEQMKRKKKHEAIASNNGTNEKIEMRKAHRNE